MQVYAQIARLITAVENCRKSGNVEWEQRHSESIETLVKDHMPSGGGFDAGTTLDAAASNPERLVFRTSFHHMNDDGYYDGWTEHSVIITPSLGFGFALRVTGRDRNEIKDYIAEAFHNGLSAELIDAAA